MAFDIKKVGGFGTGVLGDVTISNSATQVNSYANVTAIGSVGYQLTIGTPSVGAYGGFTAGQEIMFHATMNLAGEITSMGAFGFATILAVSENTLSLDKAIPVVNLTKYACQVVTVPNLNNLTVTCAVSALAYSPTNRYGGILIAKIKGLFDISNGGMWLTEGKGLQKGYKGEGVTLSNADLASKLVMSEGNGIAIVICGSYKDSANSRIGATWSGELGAGVGGTVNTGYAGGNGTATSGGNGAVGSSNVTQGGKAGYSGTDGYDGYNYRVLPGGFGGAVILLLINTIINLSLSCISTGGGFGRNYDPGLGNTLATTGGAGYGGGGGASYANIGNSGAGGGPGACLIATNSTLATNTVAYALDTLSVDKNGLLISKQALDCTALTSVDGFAADGQQPSGSNRRVIFSTNAPVVLGSRTFPITTNAVAADTVTICGVTFTAIASGATGNQFNVGVTAALTAANLAATMNANTTFNVLYLATVSDVTITVTEKVAKGNTPAAATKTGTIVIGTGTSVTSVPKWYKLTIASGAATLSAVATQTPTISSVLAEGNTVDELLTVTSIAAFVGKLVYPTIALMSSYDATVFPTLKLSLKVHCNQDQYQKDELSAEYSLADTDITIVSVTADTTTTGLGAVSVQVSLKQSGTWSGWMNMIDAKGKKGSAIKYKATYTVSKLDGTDTAKVNSVSTVYCSGSSNVSGDTAEILTITQDYDDGLGFAQCLVKHKALMDSQIKAFVAFRTNPQKREMLNIGTGNGETQTITLTDTGINHNTLSVHFDGKPAGDYGYNTETSQITFTAAAGVAVTASYEYGWEQETWLEMTAQIERIYNDSGYYSTKFTYELPNGTPNKTVSDIKIQLYRPSGTVTDAVLGTATGQRQLFVLPHYAKKETITCTGSWSYDDTSRILTVVANKDAQIKATYDWIAETHEIYGLTAGWAE